MPSRAHLVLESWGPVRGSRLRTLAILALAIALGVAVAAAGVPGAEAAEAAEYGAGTLRLEVRVWQDVENELDIHVGARPADGSWRRLG